MHATFWSLYVTLQTPVSCRRPSRHVHSADTGAAAEPERTTTLMMLIDDDNAMHTYVRHYVYLYLTMLIDDDNTIHTYVRHYVYLYLASHRAYIHLPTNDQ